MTSSQPAPAVVDGVDVDAVHEAVSACPGVAGLGSGVLGAFATYLPGRRVPGIRVNPAVIEIEVRVMWGPSAVGIARDIRTALAALVAGRRVDVTIADIQLPGELAEPAELEAAPSRLELPPAAADRLAPVPPRK